MTEDEKYVRLNDLLLVEMAGNALSQVDRKDAPEYAGLSLLIRHLGVMAGKAHAAFEGGGNGAAS